jgi:hypothetical protein
MINNLFARRRSAAIWLKVALLWPGTPAMEKS